MRQILAFLVGSVAGGASVALLQWFSSLVHPMPEGLDPQNPEQLAEWIQTLPTSAFLWVVTSWGVGALTGSFVGRRAAAGQRCWPSLAVTALLLAGTIYNLVTLPHPWWMGPVGIVLVILCGMIGLILASPTQFTVATNRSIHAPCDEVFETIARIENYCDAVAAIVHVEFLSEKKFGVGTKFRETRMMNGKRATSDLEVTELEPNQRIRIISHAGGTLWDTVFVTSPEDHHHTRLEMQMDATPSNFLAKLMIPMILPMVEAGVSSDMDAVKVHCEAQHQELQQPPAT